MFARWLVVAWFAMIGVTWFTPDLPAQYTPGRIAVLRIGDGNSQVNSGSAYAGAIYEVTDLQTSGSLNTAPTTVLTPIPTSSNSPSLTFSGSGSLEGHINRSADGFALIIPGYAASVGTADVATTAAQRGIARVAGDGSVTFQLTNSFSGNPVYSAVSDDGNRVWVTSNTDTDAGIRYFENSISPSTTDVQITNDNFRFAEIVDGTLVISSNKDISYYAGLPTIAQPQSGSIISKGLNGVNGFVLLDRAVGVGDNNLGGAVDTLYVAEKSDSLNKSTITKYSFDGSSWVERGSFNPTTVGGIFALAGHVNEAGEVVLYGTDNDGDAPNVFNNNHLFRVRDTATYDSTMTGSLDWTLNAGDGFAFRGIDFVPVPEPSSILAIGLGVLGVGVALKKHVPKLWNKCKDIPVSCIIK